MAWQDGFDSGGAAPSGSRRIFGLPCNAEEASVHLLPVPFDATTSYAAGTSRGPEAILAASLQLDLEDSWMGSVWERGVFLHEPPPGLLERSDDARKLAAPILQRGGATASDARDVAAVDAAGEHVRSAVRSWAADTLGSGSTPGVVGGEHSVSLGAIEACSANEQIGVLQIDAHMDLRPSYLGFKFSHASIMRNVLEQCPNVTKLVQVGIRDYSRDEDMYACAQEDRVSVFRASDMAQRLYSGGTWQTECARIVSELPDRVYVSFDIDGLDPSLCPNTGTPVPGGLEYNHAGMLLRTLRDSGKAVVGFDLVEVAPGETSEWDANVGARVLYMLCGLSFGGSASRS